MIQNRHAYCGVARSHWTQGMWRFERSREKRYITACRQFTQVSKFRRCQTSEVWIRDGDKITKSRSSEVSIHRKALYTTFRKPEVLFPRIVITPTYRSLESPKSRTVREVSLLRIFFLRCPSFTDVDFLLTNERHKANDHWNLVQADYSQLIAASQMSKIISRTLTLTSVIPSNFRSRRWMYIKACLVIRMYNTYTSSIKFDSIRIPVSRDITNLKKINHVRDVKNIIL